MIRNFCILFRGWKKKRGYRVLCYNELIRVGYKKPVLYFEKLQNTYDSYWGDDDLRMEVQYDPSTRMFWANEFKRADAW